MGAGSWNIMVVRIVVHYLGRKITEMGWKGCGKGNMQTEGEVPRRRGVGRCSHGLGDGGNVVEKEHGCVERREKVEEENYVERRRGGRRGQKLGEEDGMKMGCDLWRGICVPRDGRRETEKSEFCRSHK